jgi:hypothetical protein
MNALLQHLGISLRLHSRNRMALLYGYLFPLIFLVAFWVLYRHERVPLLRHMGELLTVSVLGGACFGLPTTLVSERERGVWRRYRLAPVPTWALVTSTIVARYVIVLSAGLLQLVVALAVGMTFPAHPLELFVAFTFVSFAFIGLGLVIATLADNVPAVQALGQCIFLPMLIIGGVAVPLAALPLWAQHVSAFFPGRYAVEALQACVNGNGLSATRFSLFALAMIGLAACLTGAKLFRWDAQQRFAAQSGKLWILPALGAWLVVGLLAEQGGRVRVVAADRPPAKAPPASALQEPAASAPGQPTAPGTSSPAVVPAEPGPAPLPAATAPHVPQLPLPPPVPPAAPPVVERAPEPWEKITERDIVTLDFNVPPDQGIVSPMAPPDEEPYDFLIEQVATVRDRLPTWEAATQEDDVQAIRNLLYVAAIPDAIQLPVERYLPRVVLEHLIDTYPREKLTKILTWIALHPEEGAVLTEISDLGIDGEAGDPYQVRERAYLYAIKFIARLTGRIQE